MRFDKLALAVLLSLPLWGHVARAADVPFDAKVFDFDSNKKDLLFTYKHESKIEGDTRVATNTYKDTAGAVVAIETVELVKSGDQERVRKYQLQQKQLGADGLVEVSGGKIKFSYTKDGKTKSSEESETDNFVVGPTLTAFLQRNWEQIKKGDRVKARWAVPDRAETVGFEYFKDHEEDLGGQKVIVVKMKPSSFLIAALVKPLHFAYTMDGERLVEVRGRTQLKRKVDGSYKDLDAVTTFDYGAVPAAAPAAGNSK